ncbi:MAG: hypothetical protein RLZZ136_1354 [Pseudomonadota bacterium]
MQVGQAQKEFSVNEGLSLTDALLHCAVEAVAATPPAAAQDGLAWLVAAGATGDWAGQDNKLACRQAGQWLFVTPRDGMRISNRATGQDLRRLGGVWLAPLAPAEASGGATVDAQARNAIADLVQKLRQAGVFAAS